MSADFWRGRRVLLTGHTGFKGAWLALWLRSLGAEVTGFSLPPESEPSLFALAAVDREVRSIFGDVRDAAAVDAALETSRAEVVLHLAARALVRRSYREPVDTFATNVLGTVHLLDAIRRRGSVGAIVIVTSDKVYEDRPDASAYRETDRLGGHDPYAASKACAELAAASYAGSFGLPIATARAGNVIGGGDWAEDRLVPDLVVAFRDGRRPLIRNPQAVRPWQHVLDPLHGYLMLAERLFVAPGEAGGAWNFGPDARPMTVGEIAERIARLYGGGGYDLAPGPHAHETHFLAVDSTKARSSLGWRSILPLEEALQWTAEWYRRHDQGEDARALTAAQIAAFQELIDWPTVVSAGAR
jgi:CDP-glucose 4,6-dehydratase